MKSTSFKILRYSNKKHKNVSSLLLHIRFEPKNLFKYTHEIVLRRKHEKPILLVFLAIADPLQITGPTTVSFPRCLVNDESQRLVIFTSTSQSPLKYRVTVFGWACIIELFQVHFRFGRQMESFVPVVRLIFWPHFHRKIRQINMDCFYSYVRMVNAKYYTIHLKQVKNWYANWTQKFMRFQLNYLNPQ